MIQPEEILTTMGTKAQTVCSSVFPNERPNAVTDKLSQFIVVSLPYAISNKTVGEDDDWWLDMTVVFEIYVADKKRASSPKYADLDTIQSLRESLLDLFPIIEDDNEFVIARPRIVISCSSDGDGYHYTRVQAKMTTMV